MRTILTQGVFPSFYFLISLVLNVIYLTCSIFFFKVMFDKSKAKGLARLE